MASWRCPHCGTPQQEAARCWVCHRSTTSCSTCRHFRQGVTARLGYCALDKLHTVLTGAEERACWEPSSREIRASAESAAIPVVPWTESVDEAEPSANERATASSGVARGSGADADRLGFGLFDDPGGAASELADDEAQAYDPDDLWSLYLVGPSPLLERQRAGADTTVRAAGMWVESYRSEPAMPPRQAPLTARHKNGRSVRHRPWGAVPGREDAFARSLRFPEKVPRPRS
jgi:hypothetical protein